MQKPNRVLEPAAGSDTGSAIQPSPLPVWGWILAALFYPMGPFIALASARLLKWPTAIFLAIAAYAATAGIAFTMSRLGEGSIIQTAFLVGAIIILLGAGILQFWVGARANYWSQTAKRLWTILGCLGALTFIGSIMVLIFKLF
jgi:hypothetical protein